MSNQKELYVSLEEDMRTDAREGIYGDWIKESMEIKAPKPVSKHGVFKLMADLCERERSEKDPTIRMGYMLVRKDKCGRLLKDDVSYPTKTDAAIAII